MEDAPCCRTFIQGVFVTECCKQQPHQTKSPSDHQARHQVVPRHHLFPWGRQSDRIAGIRAALGGTLFLLGTHIPSSGLQFRQHPDPLWLGAAKPRRAHRGEHLVGSLHVRLVAVEPGLRPWPHLDAIDASQGKQQKLNALQTGMGTPGIGLHLERSDDIRTVQEHSNRTTQPCDIQHLKSQT